MCFLLRGAWGDLFQKKISPFIKLDKRSVRAVCKPSSVLDDHLSRPKVAIGLKRLSRERDGPPHILSYQSCTRWGLHSGRVARPLVSSYLTFPPLRPSRRKVRGISLLHFPWSRLHWHFTSTLPCGARTFLACLRTRGRPAASQTKGNYTIRRARMSTKDWGKKCEVRPSRGIFTCGAVYGRDSAARPPARPAFPHRFREGGRARGRACRARRWRP